MKKQLDEKTRIKLKIHLFSLSLGNVLCLQRKKWYGWSTVSWVYPSIVKNKTFEFIEKYLRYEEDRNVEIKNTSEKEIGKSIMTRS